MLLAVLFMMAIMVITALAVAPAIIQQAKRDREEEMIHRGTEYARAIKKYYKKFGRYPTTIDQLESTNQMRFLRKRYKDPLTKDGQWKLLHYGDLQTMMGGAMFGVPGVAGGLVGQVQGAGGLGQPGAFGQGGAANNQAMAAAAQAGQMAALQQAAGATQNPFGGTTSSTGGSSGAGPQPFTLGPGQTQSAGPGGTQAADTTGAGGTAGQAGANGQTGTAGQTGTNQMFGSAGYGGQTFGGGAIVGVASKSKDPTIRVFNKKKDYDEWQFIYSPMMDLQNTLLRGPYNGQTFSASQVGMPAGQINQGGPQPGAPGVQLPQQNQQQNQQLTPGGQYPPDQNPPQPQ